MARIKWFCIIKLNGKVWFEPLTNILCQSLITTLAFKNSNLMISNVWTMISSKFWQNNKIIYNQHVKKVHTTWKQKWREVLFMLNYEESRCLLTYTNLLMNLMMNHWVMQKYWKCSRGYLLIFQICYDILRGGMTWEYIFLRY